MRVFLLALLMAMALAGDACGGPLDDADAAMERGDYATALRLLRPLAERGVAKAQTSMGDMYWHGYGVLQDYIEAVSWWRRAAEQGDAMAQWVLGRKYEEGLGVRQDYVRAHKWFNLAASRQPAKWLRDVAMQTRDRVAAKMAPQEIAEAQRLAREWRPNPAR